MQIPELNDYNKFHGQYPLMRPEEVCQILGITKDEFNAFNVTPVGGGEGIEIVKTRARYRMADVRKLQVKHLLGDGATAKHLLGKSSFTYFIGAADRVPEAIKIGFTAEHASFRLSALQVSSYHTLKIWAIRR